jgi:hypothetical protein
MRRDLIIEKIESLPKESRAQLEAFLDFLVEQTNQLPTSAQPPGFKFNWAGGLADLGGEFTAVELQHKANDWR